MKMSDTLRTLYTESIEQDGDDYYIRVPEQEVDAETVTVGDTYRIALLDCIEMETDNAPEATAGSDSQPPTNPVSTGPPVEQGETREVEIENLGDQGDGIAKIDQGYVVIVPETDVGERVTVEIETVQENVAFARVVNRHPRKY